MKFASALAQQRQSELHGDHVYERPEFKMILELEKFMSEHCSHANFKYSKTTSSLLH